MEEGYVEIKIEKGIGTVEFFHPAHNSLPGYLLKKLADAITQLGKDASVKVIILSLSLIHI